MLRFATSPTSDMRIDDLRVALFNYIISRQKKEDLIVRIEDIDKEKNIEGKDQEILDLLALFGIEYSQVIYQSENIKFHTAMALQLIHDKKAFSCFCSNNWLENKCEEAKSNKKIYSYDDACAKLPDELVLDNTSPFRIRVTRPERNIAVEDLIQANCSYTPDEVDAFTIMDQSKAPTYNFACGVDDMLNDISVVIRSEEYMRDTPKQEHIRDSLGYDKKMQYAHLPFILNEADEKISEEDESSSVKYLLEQGFLPEAISNYLISMGNKPPQEIFTIADAIEWFDLENISKSPTRFSIDILRHINREHLLALDAKELSRYVGFADEEIGNLARVYLKKSCTTKELKENIAPIFANKEIPQEFVNQAKIMVAIIKSAPYFEEYDDFKNFVMKESGLEDEDFSQVLPYVLTGAGDGPDIREIYKYLKNYIAEIVK